MQKAFSKLSLGRSFHSSNSSKHKKDSLCGSEGSKEDSMIYRGSMESCHTDIIETDPKPGDAISITETASKTMSPTMDNGIKDFIPTDYPIETCADGKVCVNTGPPPCLHKPLTIDELPHANFDTRESEALNALRQQIDAVPISNLSAEEAQRIQGLELESRSGSGWFSGFLNRTNTPEYAGRIDSLLWDEVLWLKDDSILWRYLRSYDWNVEAAKKCLFQTLQWRRFRQPHRIHPDEVKSAAVKGNIYRKGFDNKGRPIIYFRPGVEGSTSTKAAQLHSVYTMERAMQSLNKAKGCEQLVFLMDFSNWGISQVPTMDLSKEVVNILSDHYTDTLATCYIVDAPGYFDACWSVIKLMLHENTSKKVKFVHTNKPKDLTLLKSEIPEIYLEDYLGGLSAVSYDHEKYWKAEVEQYEKFVEFQNEQIVILQSDATLVARQTE